MSKPKDPVSKEAKAAFLRALDEILNAHDARGFMMLCCAFTPEGIRTATYALGSMNMEKVLEAIAKCGGELLGHMERQAAQLDAETRSPEARQ